MVEVEINGEAVKASYSIWALSLYVDEGKKPEFKLDFTANDWAMLSRVLWAGVKNEDDSTPSFAEWAKSVESYKIFEIAGKVPNEVMRVCF